MFLLRRVAWVFIKLLIKYKFPEVQQLTTRDLAIWLGKEGVEKPKLLDGRKQEEYLVSHLQDAKLVPSCLEDLVKWEGLDFSTPIVVYCSVGYRSAKIATRLQSLGYKQVFNLQGSIFEWVNEGRSLYRGEEEVNKVHPYNKFWGYLVR
ncbi:MAG: rhodanese-like domain-containing protein [Prochloraceae cyanobacterium]|nr:rhodanese-like domain-containing protein [Prochloraceae cyanobacterium]